MVESSTSIERTTRPYGRNGAPLGTGRDLRRRLVAHHLPIAVASAMGLVVLVRVSPGHSRGISIQRLVSPTGDVALVLLAVTLLIGPAQLLLRRRNPPHTYLRRDVGIWTAVWSLIHVIVSFQGHIIGKIHIRHTPPGNHLIIGDGCRVMGSCPI